MQSVGARLLACILAVWGTSGDARGDELSAHRALVDVITKPGTKLAPFTTDGCSGGMSGTWRTLSAILPDFADMVEENPPWEGCCIAHDRLYHDAGGARDAKASYEARIEADKGLAACVRATGKDRQAALTEAYGLSATDVERMYGMIADAMYRAVRLGGGPCTGLPWRWGYGFPDCKPAD